MTSNASGMALSGPASVTCSSGRQMQKLVISDEFDSSGDELSRWRRFRTGCPDAGTASRYPQRRTPTVIPDTPTPEPTVMPDTPTPTPVPDTPTPTPVPDTPTPTPVPDTPTPTPEPVTPLPNTPTPGNLITKSAQDSNRQDQCSSRTDDHTGEEIYSTEYPRCL